MMKKIFLAATSVIVSAFLLAAAYGQNAGTVTNHAFPIGKGAGVTGYTSLLCASGQLAVGQAAADPICRTLSGDATFSAAGALTLATVNANVGAFGSATQCTTVTYNAKGLVTAASQTTCTPAVGSISGFGTGVAAALAINIGSAGAPVLFNGAGGTPSSLTLTNATGLPVGSVTGLSAGCPTWLATASSANLRACITDETGTGLAYFQGGDIGTPSAGVGTNFTGTAAGLTAGNATKLTTPRAIGIAGSTGLTATGVNFDGTAAINPALTGTLVFANGGTNDTGTAPSASGFTPAFSCGTATFANNSSTFKLLAAKVTYVQIDFTITAIGTCTSPVNFTLPSTAQTGAGAAGRETAVAGTGVFCSVSAASASMGCVHPSGTAFIVNERVVASGIYTSP